MSKFLFCDIDGTLTQTISGNAFKQDSTDVKVIECADKAIAYFASQGYKIIGISNQGGIEKRFKSLETTIEEMRYTLQILPQLNVIYFCPDFAGTKCYCVTREEEKVHNFGAFFPEYQGFFRKPSSGMIDLALHVSGEVSVETWMVGDRTEDEGCAINAGINFVWADIWREIYGTAK
ncbi:hypothetical protein PCC6912_40190 [Chlorogloeopsis fritschii PCC 6912]|uniref:D,D-heptose 1,7-bisphosphate phosphatase n=1 Tax=Chlorogloeopsis fritschii PCC 6912 TaxID=211165 RepID=A0A3S0ZTH2_CHLFR|nr:HAD-IIIA family hydrolase [Chlorogloeopsis fritschii]RUR77060.1 hypothetical protein PCC6912_40190 [Chlorogloeopsis fritschii PCC 6912]